MEQFTVGVEEEFFLVDARTGALRSEAEAVIRATPSRPDDQIEHELHQSQVELGTPVCTDLDELRREIATLRDRLSKGADEVGARILASGTHPFTAWDDEAGVTPTPDYLRLERQYQQLTREQLLCGCHVHVGISDPEMVIQVMNRVRVWLPVLVALAGNSPYWLGDDTGYSSYRTEVFRRWPTAGIPEPFTSRDEYDALVDDMVAIEGIDRAARLYWDLRPSARYDTLEFRATDVATRVGDAVTMAVLARALVETGYGEVLAGDAAAVPRPELLRSALWRAARFGLDDGLVDVHRRSVRPAADIVGELLAKLRPVLERRGEWSQVRAVVERLLAEGNGAHRQRRAYEDTGDLHRVVVLLAEETVEQD